VPRVLEPRCFCSGPVEAAFLLRDGTRSVDPAPSRSSICRSVSRPLVDTLALPMSLLAMTASMCLATVFWPESATDTKMRQSCLPVSRAIEVRIGRALTIRDDVERAG